MAKEKKPTTDEHFVPVTYLKGFSNDGRTIFFYDLLCKKNSDCAVPIKSVCYKKNLYEARNEEGKFIYRNWVENCLAQLEILFTKRREDLETKAFCVENLSCNMFLKEEEKAFWALYVVIQMLRSPETLKVAKEFCRVNLEKELGQAKAENFGLALCLPFFERLTDDSKTVIGGFIKPMENMYMEIGVITDENIKLFTSDNPVYVHCKNWPCEEYEKIIFPISSKLCLFMYGGTEKLGHKKNGLFIIDQSRVDEIYWSIAYRADERIYSPERIIGNIRARVNEAHKDRLSDDMKKMD